MSQQLIDRNPDIKRLRDEGYEVEVRGGYLIVHHIPYLNYSKEIKYGVLITELTLSNTYTVAKPHNHVIHFMGEHPCDKDGRILSQIQHASNNTHLLEGVVASHSFSNKPPNGYDNYYQKISRYAEIISAPAKSLDTSVTEKTFKVIAETDERSVFQYLDTNSSRANLTRLCDKFKTQKIAIIGLGGTGSYILDLVAKVPVQEIHLFDGDDFLQHNAFRSPGAASQEELGRRLKKVDYYAETYGKMHKNIIPHGEYFTRESLLKINQISYVFVCIDKNGVKKEILGALLNAGIPFIDVGLGVNLIDDVLIGTLRVTCGTPSKNNHLGNRIATEDNENNEYSSNIQIADLNSLNAALAVVKWKKMSGFYQDLEEEHHTTYSINVAQLINEDTTA